MTSFLGNDITCGGVTSHGVYDIILGVCDVILVVRRLLEVVTSRMVCDVIFGE